MSTAHVHLEYHLHDKEQKYPLGIHNKLLTQAITS